VGMNLAFSLVTQNIGAIFISIIFSLGYTLYHIYGRLTARNANNVIVPINTEH